MVSTGKAKKGKTSKFVDVGGYNKNEREREGGINNLEWVERRVEKKNKTITLGTERCENIKTLYI